MGPSGRGGAAVTVIARVALSDGSGREAILDIPDRVTVGYVAPDAYSFAGDRITVAIEIPDGADAAALSGRRVALVPLAEGPLEVRP